MDKNTIIGVVLMVALLMGFSYYNSTTQELPQQNVESTEKVEISQQQVAVPQQVVTMDSTALFFNALQGESQQVVLENEKIRVAINAKGGTIADVRLKEFKNYQDFKEGKNTSLPLYKEEMRL